MTKLEVTSSPDSIIISGQGQSFENTLTLSLNLWDDAEGVSETAVKPRKVTVSFYSDFATKAECDQTTLTYQGEKSEPELLKDGEFISAKSISIKGVTVPCRFGVLLKKAVSHFFEEGQAHIQVQVNLSDGTQLKQKLAFKRVTEQEPKILDFYPEHGSLLPGSQARLKWKIQGGIAKKGEAYIEGGGKTYPIAPKTESMLVPISKTAKFTLHLLKDEVHTDERELWVQVLPVYLKTFYVEESRKNAVWEICCAKTLKAGGESYSPEEIEYKKSIRDKTLLLEASDGKNRILSTLYCGREPGQEENDIRHFRKTLTFRSGIWFLNVQWQKLSLTSPQLKAARKLVLTFKDKKAGLEEVFYQAEGSDIHFHEWEMILENCSAETINQDVQIIMDVTSVDGAVYSITI